MGFRKMSKLAAAWGDDKRKADKISKKGFKIERKKERLVHVEEMAVGLTAGQEDDEGRPCRRLTNFVLQNSDGLQQPFQMLEVVNMFISGHFAFGGKL